MSPIDDPLPLPDDGRIDLLVDGELSEAERRELLASLDDLPGGWRRCALAFLEAQSWKDGLGSIRRESAARPAPRAIRRARFPGGLFGTLAAMAASFMLALGLGVMLKGVWRSGPEPRPAPLASAEAAEQAPAQSPDHEQPEPSAVAQSLPGEWQVVPFPVGFGPDGAESIPLPARETDRIDDQWLERFGPRVPAELVRAFEQSGHEVRRSRRLVPFLLDDGRQVVVPFEEVEFRPVRNAPYQ